MRCDLSELALNLVRGAFMELYLTPKPGLVDLNDPGSHRDLSVSLMEDSLLVVSSYLTRLADALGRGEEFGEQVRLGQAAERAMLEAVGTNCHKGYIFLSGLLLSASSGLSRRDEKALRQAVASLAQHFFARCEPPASNGSKARAAYRAQGVRGEALAGFPSLFDAALPAYRGAIARGMNRGGAVYAMLGRLMSSVEDTTALHRCGEQGLETLREDGRRIEELVAAGEDFISFLSRRNEEYVRQNLTMGGVADMLALSFAWLSHTGELELSA